MFNKLAQQAIHFAYSFEEHSHLYYNYKKALGNLLSTLTKFHCKSIIDRYKNQNESLDQFSLVIFLINDD